MSAEHDTRQKYGYRAPVSEMTPGTVIRTQEYGPWVLTDEPWTMLRRVCHLWTGELHLLYCDTMVTVCDLKALP